VQSPVLHTRAQRGHVTNVRPPTAGWQADRENGYGRTPSNAAAYANKSLQELCRNCVRPARKPRRTGTNTASHRRASGWPQPVDSAARCGAPMSLGEGRRKHFPAVLLQPLGHLSGFKINNLRTAANDYRTRRVQSLHWTRCHAFLMTCPEQ
jgi:hypothetical protein